MKIVGVVKYFSWQGQAFQGVDKESGNFSQLLKYKAEGDAELTTWLKGHFDFTSPQMQNKICAQYTHQRNCVGNNINASGPVHTYH